MSAEKDIAWQLPLEHSIAIHLSKTFGGMIQPNKPGRDAEKDFTLFMPQKIEVKCDYMSKQTRNAFFEVWNCRLNKPSGLKATTAARWAFCTPGDGGFYTFNPKRMLLWLEDESGIEKLTGCGDRNSDGYIVPLKTLCGLPFVKWHEFIA